MDLRDFHYWKDKKVIGTISTLKRKIDKRRERIKNNQREIHQFQSELKIKQKELKLSTKIWFVNVYIKKIKSGKYTYYKGRVRFWGRDYEYHIGNEETYMSMIKKLGEKKGKRYWKIQIRNRFIKKLTKDDLEGYLSE